MKLIWSDKAEEDFDCNIDYLYRDWNEEVVLDFTTETARVLKIIRNTPRAFRKDKKTNVHCASITKHITLFYDVQQKEIVLLRFWNNYQNPRKRRLS
jgi:plasmid stabilization system protein ParE